VSVHAKNFDGTLKELHRPSGGPWGGTKVDDIFIAWLEEIFGKGAMTKLKEESMDEYLGILREFECKKRIVTPDSKGKITLSIPGALKKFHKRSGEEKIESKIVRLNLTEDVSFKDNKIRVSADNARSWFKEPIEDIVLHLTGILSEPAMGDVTTVILVGGFAECELVQNAVKKDIGNRTVIIPEEAGLAVLKGAVLFGHRPRFVFSRCVKFTYGYGVSEHFDDSKHRLEKMFIDSCGDRRAHHCYEKVVEIGTSVDVGKDIKSPSALFLRKNEKNIIPIYASTDRDPEYYTDPSCTKVGEVDIGCAPGQTNDDNEVEVYFAFGDTELKATVKILKTGKVVSATMNCL